MLKVEAEGNVWNLSAKLPPNNQKYSNATQCFHEVSKENAYGIFHQEYHQFGSWIDKIQTTTLLNFLGFPNSPLLLGRWRPVSSGILCPVQVISLVMLSRGPYARRQWWTWAAVLRLRSLVLILIWIIYVIRRALLANMLRAWRTTYYFRMFILKLIARPLRPLAFTSKINLCYSFLYITDIWFSRTTTCTAIILYSSVFSVKRLLLPRSHFSS